MTDEQKKSPRRNAFCFSTAIGFLLGYLTSYLESSLLQITSKPVTWRAKIGVCHILVMLRCCFGCLLCGSWWNINRKWLPPTSAPQLMGLMTRASSDNSPERERSNHWVSPSSSSACDVCGRWLGQTLSRSDTCLHTPPFSPLFSCWMIHGAF